MFASLLLLSSLASAQMEACPGPYDNNQLLADLDQIDDTLRGFDIDTARQQMSGVHRSMLCLEERVDPHGISRFGRQLSLAFFFDQDEDALARWAMLPRTVAPDLPWYADMGEDHTYRMLVAEIETPPTVGPDASLLVPKKAAVYWNGLRMVEAKAPIETPGLVQVVDKTGLWTDVWWQDGSAFPEDFLGEPGPPLPVPKGYQATAPDARFAEHAARPLFEQAAPEIAKSEPEVFDEATVAKAQEQQVAGEYIDPFESARRRTIRREYFVRNSTNEAGDKITKTIEVLTFSRDDRSAGVPITYEIFEYWLKDHPNWGATAMQAKGRASEHYLSDWVDRRPPPNTAHAPLGWVSHDAATAYCQSFGKRLPSPDDLVENSLTWEWRASNANAIRVNDKGKARVETDALTVRQDTGFRCLPEQPTLRQ